MEQETEEESIKRQEKKKRQEEQRKREQEVVYEKPERPGEKAATNIFELLDRILDKGIVIVGDIRISVADIELLKIQIRLLICSVDKAKELGIDFSWAKGIEETKTKEQLLGKIKELEGKVKGNKPEETQ